MMQIEFDFIFIIISVDYLMNSGNVTVGEEIFKVMLR